MSDSHERIAADILIAALQRGGGNAATWPTSQTVKEDAEKLSSAFQTIFDTVQNARISK